MLKRTIVIVAVLLAVSSLAFAQGFTAPDVIKVTGKFSDDRLRQGHDFKFALILDIKKGFHVNANVPTADFPTTVKIKALPGIKFGTPQYPKPVMKSFNFAPTKIPIYEGRVVISVPGKVEKSAAVGTQAVAGEVSYQACDDASCYPPSEVVFQVPVKIVKPDTAVKKANGAVFVEKAKPAPTSVMDKQTEYMVRKIENGGVFFLFLAGMALCLTPCVYPMIPVIVGYFGNQGDGKKSRVAFLALLFVIGLAFTYSVLGTAAALAGTGFGNVMQSPAVPVVIAGILVALSLSLFGLYDIPVPNFIANRSGARSGGLGALIMGLIFGFVAAPCIGPVIAGLLFVVAKLGSPIKGFTMFFALSLGLGTPFFFLAIFSGSLARLPKAGNWMVIVKKLFGFLMLGAAVYYISQLFPKETAEFAIPVFLIIAGIYWALLERTTRQMRLVRPIQQLLGIGVVAWGAWSVFSPAQPSIVWTPYTEQAVVSAEKAKMPVMIDFTATWCNPCKELEETTFSDPDVLKESSRFARLSVDLTRKSQSAEKIKRELSVPAPPVIILIGSNGLEQDRVIGYIGPDDFLKKIQKIR